MLTLLPTPVVQTAITHNSNKSSQLRNGQCSWRAWFSRLLSVHHSVGTEFGTLFENVNNAANEAEI